MLWKWVPYNFKFFLSLNIWFKVPFGAHERKFILFLTIYPFQLDSTLFNNSMRSVRNKKGAVVSQLCSSAVSEWHYSLNTGNKREKERSGQRAWKWINQLKTSLVTDLWSKERHIISFSFSMVKLYLESSWGKKNSSSWALYLPLGLTLIFLWQTFLWEK